METWENKKVRLVNRMEKLGSMMVKLENMKEM